MLGFVEAGVFESLEELKHQVYDDFPGILSSLENSYVDFHHFIFDENQPDLHILYHSGSGNFFHPSRFSTKSLASGKYGSHSVNVKWQAHMHA
jgi:hypothetical protein